MTGEIYLTPTGHAKDCDWHVDQYPWECTCGFIPRKQAMDKLIAQDADLIDKLRDTDSYYRLQEKHWCIDAEELERQRLAAADLIETQAREIERLGVIAGGNARLVCKVLDEKDAEIERLNTLLSEMNDTDVIARTMAENERLREALEEWMFRYYWRVDGMNIEQARIHARAALAGDSHD